MKNIFPPSDLSLSKGSFTLSEFGAKMLAWRSDSGYGCPVADTVKKWSSWRA
jgi:hypothetical protein